MTTNKKTLTIKEQVRELVYDIQNKAHLVGVSREYEGVTYEAASNMQANDDDESSYQIKRSIASAFSFIKNNLGEYLVGADSTAELTSDNILKKELEDDTYLSLTFKLPNNFNASVVDSISEGIHSYLVCMALADWFAITNKNDAQTYVAQAAVALETVRRAIYKRIRPSRPIYTEVTDPDDDKDPSSGGTVRPGGPTVGGGSEVVDPDDNQGTTVTDPTEGGTSGGEATDGTNDTDTKPGDATT